MRCFQFEHFPQFVVEEYAQDGWVEITIQRTLREAYVTYCKYRDTGAALFYRVKHTPTTDIPFTTMTDPRSRW